MISNTSTLSSRGMQWGNRSSSGCCVKALRTGVSRVRMFPRTFKASSVANKVSACPTGGIFHTSLGCFLAVAFRERLSAFFGGFDRIFCYDPAC